MALGCTSQLETGYKPRKLGVSESERRAFYSDPFSLESRAADASRQADSPRPGR